MGTDKKISIVVGKNKEILEEKLSPLTTLKIYEYSHHFISDKIGNVHLKIDTRANFKLFALKEKNVQIYHISERFFSVRSFYLEQDRSHLGEKDGILIFF
ncbi:hypothetical protein SAMN04487943_11553 [Gracilibacillus orientalis]|uniref:Uncharacterized protein n=1 Tax=Gracilibacillus orientalis TaxID=334253 RepID=A0A1I4QBC6_9BACI|nr:hypothetical protein SAMN04487943_11553 [Gracilibacillus orientalis]